MQIEIIRMTLCSSASLDIKRSKKLHARRLKTFNALSERVNATMKTLGCDQVSGVKGPKETCRASVLGLPAKSHSR